GGAVFDRGDEVAAVAGGGRLRSGRRIDRGIGVDEVEALVADAGEHRGIVRGADLSPAHVRHDRGFEGGDGPGPQSDALGLHPVLPALGEEYLQADGYAQQRTALFVAGADEVDAADVVESGHHGGEGSDAGDEESVGVVDDIVVA